MVVSRANFADVLGNKTPAPMPPTQKASPAKKPPPPQLLVAREEVKSVFGKAPRPQKTRKQAHDDDDEDESSEPSQFRQIVQSILRRMELIFGVEE